jgi:predicted metal-dependent hydrolase
MSDLVRPPRYSARQLPPYSYVTGQFPHPIRDPAGHSYGQLPESVTTLDESNWRTNPAWLWAIDLFNRAFYWEAHEAWEGLWHAAGRRGPTADFLKGLIKLAAAGVKHREGRPEGVRRHAARAIELLSPSRGRVVFGVTVDALLTAASYWTEIGQLEGQELSIWLQSGGAGATDETRIEHG